MSKNIQFSPFTGNSFPAGKTYAELGLSLPGGESKSVSAADFLSASDVDSEGGGAKLTSPYAQSAWVYIAISRLAEKVAQIPFRISKVTHEKARRVKALRGSSDPTHRNFCRRALGETIVESGDVVDMFNRPHATMSRQLFWETIVTWNCLRGEFFVVPVDDNDCPVDLSSRSAKVRGLVTLPPDNFWHVVQGYELAVWRFTGSPLSTPLPSEFLIPGEVVHSRTPNPFLYWRGMSPLVVAMIAAGADFAASKYNQGYWLNNADTGLIVSTEQWPTPEQRTAILAALRERKRKAGTPDRPLFLGGGAKVEKPTLSGMETQFIENRRMNRQEIGAIYKVSDAIMGFSPATALSGGDAKKSEEQSFVENTIMPLCEHLEVAVEPILKSFGEEYIGWFDIWSLPVMQEAQRARLDSGVKAFNMGVPINDVNKVYDLGFPDYPWGNKSFLPFSLQEVGGAEPEVIEPDVVDAAKSNPFLRMGNLLSVIKEGPAPLPKFLNGPTPKSKALWERHIATRKKFVTLFESKTGKVLNNFRGSTLAKFNEINLQKTVVTKSLIDLIFSGAEFGKALNSELQKPIRSLLGTATEELLSEIGATDPWKMPPAKVGTYLDTRTQEILGVGGTVRDRLNTAIQAGTDAGETTDEIASRIRATFNALVNGKENPDGEGMTMSEARRVAQTEVNMAYNFSRHEAMIGTGIEYKSWLSSHGPNVRMAHQLAEEQYSNYPILLNDPFVVGGEELMFPGDDSLGASAGNVINCQCIQLAAQKVSEDEKSATFKIFGLGEIKFSKS